MPRSVEFEDSIQSLQDEAIYNVFGALMQEERHLHLDESDRIALRCLVASAWDLFQNQDDNAKIVGLENANAEVKKSFYFMLLSIRMKLYAMGFQRLRHCRSFDPDLDRALVKIRFFQTKAVIALESISELDTAKCSLRSLRHDGLTRRTSCRENQTFG